jgi:hypothetical protein
MSVTTAEMPQYAALMTSSATTMPIGMDFWGFLVSSPELQLKKKSFTSTCHILCSLSVCRVTRSSRHKKNTMM